MPTTHPLAMALVEPVPDPILSPPHEPPSWGRPLPRLLNDVARAQHRVLSLELAGRLETRPRRSAALRRELERARVSAFVAELRCAAAGGAS
ncbi:MAG: hypothetical protein KC543_00800 [Myxococcales bacterium]|nr:hypothetical protein [Myxococcales bacterium]